MNLNVYEIKHLYGQESTTIGAFWTKTLNKFKKTGKSVCFGLEMTFWSWI